MENGEESEFVIVIQNFSIENRARIDGIEDEVKDHDVSREVIYDYWQFDRIFGFFIVFMVIL